MSSKIVITNLVSGNKLGVARTIFPWHQLTPAGGNAYGLYNLLSDSLMLWLLLPRPEPATTYFDGIMTYSARVGKIFG